MKQQQRGVWLVQWALYRGARHARKQRMKNPQDTVDFDEYAARRAARMQGGAS